MISLNSYKGYSIYVSNNGWFFAFDKDHGDEVEEIRGNSVSSSQSYNILTRNIDGLESSVQRNRDRPEFPVIDANGYKGTVKGIHAGTGNPNTKMEVGNATDVFYLVPLVERLIADRRQLLTEALAIVEQLSVYRLPSLRYKSRDVNAIAAAETKMKSRWEELKAIDASNASKAQEDHI
ncbi:hypothetical protein LCGC14_0857280 [marine sediment metagenome]|uniref:Uncharacterized protein n=1 Tax=marine sediment metagenome TaxID=412755 RepID=A0A0F9PTU7_9ZZZZ